MTTRRIWIITVTTVVVVALLVVGGIVLAGQHGKATQQTAFIQPSSSGPVAVTGAPTGTRFTITQTTGQPVSIPGVRALTSAYEITPQGDPGTSAQIHMRLDPSKLPAGEPSCAAPTTDINLGILVYNTSLQGWVPLPTTCTGHDLVATAPHFSTFIAAILDAGSHAVSTVVHGLSFVSQVITTTVTSIFSYVADVMTQVVATLVRNLTGTFDDAKFVCDPASKNRGATVVTATGATNSRTLAGCVVASAEGDEYRMKNGLAIPLALDLPAQSQSYLTPVTDPSAGLDIFGLLESAAAYARGKLLVPGLEVGALRVATRAPDPIHMHGSADQVSLMLDIAVAALTIIAPEFKVESVEMREITTIVDQRLFAIATRDGYQAVSLTTVTTVIRDVVAEKPGWGAYAENLLDTVDLVKCLTSGGTTPQAVVQTALNCARTVFGGGGSEVKSLLLAVVTQAKVLPELVESDIVAAFQSATGVDITGVDVTISGAPVWLFTVPAQVVAAGPSSQRIDTVLAGQEYPDSTGMWVGCDNGLPATATYQFGGAYRRLIATLGLSAQTPPDITAHIVITGDGRTLATTDVTRDTSTPIDLDVTGVQTLVVSALRTTGTCTASNTPYGALGNAGVFR